MTAETPGSDTRRVLIVDDNPQNLELLEAYLEDVPGVATLRATSGADALELIAQSPPDLLLLDVMMPRMSGFEVCKQLKADARTAAIPIVLVTALNEFADEQRGREVGADDFLSKPVNRHELISRVQRLLARAGSTARPS